MKKIKTVQDLRRAIYVTGLLRKLQRQIGGVDCADCNGTMTHRQETRRENLLKKAEELAQSLGLHAYHQGDPRGCSLYLVENNKGADTNYTDGIACCE